MMPAFWHWFVVAGTILFVAWCAWLVGWASRQGPPNKSDTELVGHRWDGDLEEWNNPAPKWWLYLYFITVIWGVGYLVAYPGLGNFAGMLGWSQASQYDMEQAVAAERYEPIYARFADMEFEQLARDPDARKLGASLFASYCTTCHGSDARGARGFPNLADDAWLWGNSEQQLTTTIANGRNGIMPQLGPALGGEPGIAKMAKYVRSLGGLVEADADAMSMQPMFVALCSACHMADGTGNPLLGGPNLTDDDWLYGGSEADVVETITQGRNGMMPAHGGLLGPDRTKILAAWVYGLSSPD